MAGQKEITPLLAAWNEEDEDALDSATPLVHDALHRIASSYVCFDLRNGRVLEMRYFGGVSVEEAADALKVSRAAVVRDWSMAKAWRRVEIAPGLQNAT